MPLVIEDGTVVSGANSFVTDAELQAFAELRSVELPALKSEREALAVKAMDYLLSIESRLKGDRTSASQLLPFPRINVYAHNFIVPSDAIPQGVKNAQMQAAIDANSFDLLHAGEVSNVQSEKVGELSRSYFNGGSWKGVQLKTVDAFLAPYIDAASTIRAVRV